MTQKHFQNLLSKLELPNDEVALHWVAEQNQKTIEKFAQSRRFQETQQIILKSLNNQAKIPWGEHYHDTVYNFWQDDNHPRGIWRRTQETSYLTGKPEWETVLDIDHLNEEENANWSYHGADLLYPDFTRALVFLSSGGDACEIREFDLINKTFISDGFFLPESKSSVTWLDENSLLLALDAGGDTLTTSGYPRCVSLWQRGTIPQEAALIYAGETSDMMVSAWRTHTPGYEKTLVRCYRDFYHSLTYQLTAQGKLVSIDIPEDASCGFFNAWLLITLATPWKIADKMYPAGALLAIDFASFQEGQRNFTTLFTPDEQTTLQGYSSTRDYLILNLTLDVVGRVEVLKVENGLWCHVQMLTLPDFTTISASGIDIKNNRYQLISYGFLQPYCLSYGDLDNNTLSVVKQEPACFDKANFEVTRHFAQSPDGTLIPYFQIASKGLELTGEHPTLLYGYGGFEVSLTPEYLGAKGATWLQKGGVYIVANIRGGGEYGPQWHQAALKQNRHRAFEDFAAVAKDLITRRVTCSARLAAQGGSNGGLLIGNMLTDYPTLFGALLCEVPLLDMTNYHRWLAGSSWIAEFGDPEVAEERQWLQSYSPFDKVSSDKCYPPVLFTTGTKDDRVSPAHARKMVARMQQQGHHNIWLYEETDAGHGSAPENAQIAFYHAMTEEFLWQMLEKNQK
ncbi:prolyl oligopeptidase family serine peptidase [Acinetobacter sp.]|uniref:prolyl oligopeptidase family serine peptidase n=1 Tax=Acinetobacter sp. TaxID=472 RepID=UPI0028372003|nr:prolyl oligopeptidase family serine peptidase [Acinetobacter sp.]MDR2249405.1 prolyl oligopeptidase family serine peptidase [Acinetobacter sp.]